MNGAEPLPCCPTARVSWRFTDEIGIGTENATGARSLDCRAGEVLKKPLKIAKTLSRSGASLIRGKSF
jgi:hypothetical protein